MFKNFIGKNSNARCAKALQKFRDNSFQQTKFHPYFQ